jgi:hypothetical protein
LSLESAIREVEANIAGKSETELRESKPDLAQPHTAAVSLNSEHSAANYETQQPEGRELSYDLDEEQPHPA